MNDQNTRLQALLDNLENGRISIADACDQIRGMNFPRRQGKTAYQTRVAAALNEWDEPPPEGSAADIAHEYHAGRLTHLQYEQLYRAVNDQGEHDTGGAVPAGS